jgi:hypothetical protein
VVYRDFVEVTEKYLLPEILIPQLYAIFLHSSVHLLSKLSLSLCSDGEMVVYKTEVKDTLCNCKKPIKMC